MEYRYLKMYRDVNLRLFQYNGDILVVNNPDFPVIASDIYGATLELKSTYSGQRACFLDLDISYHGTVCTSDVCNKALDSPFPANFYNALNSDVDRTLHERILIFQMLRYSRIYTSLDRLVWWAERLVSGYLERGYDVRKFVNRHTANLAKYLYCDDHGNKVICASILSGVSSA
ncbi:unnamed protein product [Gongylonema pulchrum]|uniref:DNA-directed DNA polymerase n=1 Tax=Gongylonema pulchrum TaxID=637853 RepID=A0A183DY64_9BILA|nr:unnamed protein product [Gongylonema pulchrum]